MIQRLKNAVQDRANAWIFNRYVNRVIDNLSVDRGTQILLSLKYREMLHRGDPLPSFDDVGFRAHSQMNEDGILLLLFSVLGTTNKQAVEMCVEQGIECNAANLILNHGWQGLLFDGSAANVRAGRRFYARHRSTWMWPPTLAQAWITAEGINDLLQGHGCTGEIDLLSIDIDGMDYWVWRALTVAQPRVVVVEYQTAWGPEAAVTVPYDPQFDRFRRDPDYWGASLGAFVALGREKGYRLIGCNQFGTNAFFLRDDLGRDLFPSVPPETCFRHPYTQQAIRERLPKIRRYPWQAV